MHVLGSQILCFCSGLALIAFSLLAGAPLEEGWKRSSFGSTGVEV